MFLSKSEEETTSNRKLAKELVDKWVICFVLQFLPSIPIWSFSANFSFIYKYVQILFFLMIFSLKNCGTNQIEEPHYPLTIDKFSLRC